MSDALGLPLPIKDENETVPVNIRLDEKGSSRSAVTGSLARGGGKTLAPEATAGPMPRKDPFFAQGGKSAACSGSTSDHESNRYSRAVKGAHCSPNERPELDRRRRRRAIISAPVRVRCLNATCSGPDEITTTIDVSRAGILLVTSEPGYYRGMDVAVIFPYIKSSTAIHAEQSGRVVRTHDLPGGRRAVAVAIGMGVGEDFVNPSGRKMAAEQVQGSRSVDSLPERPLVVALDSDDKGRNLLKSYLINEGYEVIAVNNAADAREVLNMFTPVLVIAEIEGKGMPGYVVCSHVKETPRLRHIPVILTTRSGYPSDYSSAHSRGAVVCMAKPYKQERLGTVMRLLAPIHLAKEPTHSRRAHHAGRASAGKG
jgi:CheY-like chemotaxis protein